MVRCALIQAANVAAADRPLAEVKQAMMRQARDLHRAGRSAARRSPASRKSSTARISAPSSRPAGTISPSRFPTAPPSSACRSWRSKHHMAMIVPIYEVEQEGVYYNTAAVIDRTGTYLGKYRKTHIPHVAPGFWEKFYFRPGNLGYPAFDLGFVQIGVYICYDRHFPEGARALGLNGAEIVFNPSATVAGLSEHLWKIEQPAHAVANGYFIGAINRVGTEAPWNIGHFYGSSYFCNPRGQIIAQASREKDEVLIADLDLDQIKEVRQTWQFFRDRRPDAYEDLVKA